MLASSAMLGRGQRLHKLRTGHRQPQHLARGLVDIVRTVPSVDRIALAVGKTRPPARTSEAFTLPAAVAGLV